MNFRYPFLLLSLLFSIQLTIAGQRLGFDEFKIYADTENLSFQELSDFEENGTIAFGEYEGLSPSINYYWIKIDPSLILDADYLLLSNFFERIEGYQKGNPKPFSVTGNLVEYEDRDYQKGFYRLVLLLPQNEESVYIKLFSEEGNSIFNRSLSHLEFISADDLEGQSNRIFTTFTLLTGMEMIILIINILLIYLKPSKTGISYIAFIFVGMLLVIFNAQIFIVELGIPVVVSHYLELIFGVLIVFSFNLFSVFFLKAYQLSKIIYRILVFPSFLFVFGTIWFDNGYYFPFIATVYFLGSLPLIIILLKKSWKSNPKNAKTFVFANGFSVLAALIMVLALKDIIPHHFLTTNVVFLGFIFRDIHFTTNLVTRYFHLQKDQIVRETVIKKLEEDNLTIKRIEELKTQFFNNASHELRTPLTLILSPLEETLKNKELSEKVRNELNLSLSNGKYLLQLVNEMLDLAKLDNGKLELTRQPTDVVRVVKKIKENFASYAKERKQTLFIAHADESAMAMLDHDKFEKIMINLISNAIKYSNKRGKIFIAIDEGDTDLEIQVEDEGQGIRASELESVFDRYYQSNATDQTGGTGIGLAIVKEFMELHDGTVTCTSKYGHGTTFTLSFPKAVMKKRPHSNDELLVDTSLDGQLATILLVEDHPGMNNYLKRHLEDFNVISAINGTDALLKLKTGFEPDLILTDYMMPEMDGYELAQKVKSDDQWRDIPIIFLTAVTLSEDKVKVLNLGVDDYIIKPFNLEELKVRIANVIEVRRKRKEQHTEEGNDFTKDNESGFKSELDAYIIENITNPQLSNTTLASYFSLSERNLYRRIKAVAGRTPAAYIREIRLQKARRMLEKNQEINVSEVAYSCGIENLAHFSQTFKKRFGKSPSEFSNTEVEEPKK